MDLMWGRESGVNTWGSRKIKEKKRYAPKDLLKTHEFRDIAERLIPEKMWPSPGEANHMLFNCIAACVFMTKDRYHEFILHDDSRMTIESKNKQGIWDPCTNTAQAESLLYETVHRHRWSFGFGGVSKKYTPFAAMFLAFDNTCRQVKCSIDWAEEWRTHHRSHWKKHGLLEG